MATGTSSETAGWREQWFGRFDGSLFALCAASLAVVVAGGLVQVSFGTFSMTVVDAWQAVFNPRVVFDAQAWQAHLARHQIWSRAFPYSKTLLRLGLPAPQDWSRLEAVL